MSGDHRHQRPLTSLEKQDSWLSGLLYHVIFFSDLYISYWNSNVNNFSQFPAKSIEFQNKINNLTKNLTKENSPPKWLKPELGCYIINPGNT